MFKTFLSWRYLRNRRTNLIGIVGILVGVGALILILSIMTGFLEQSRSTVRGSLADIIVAPKQSHQPNRARNPFGVDLTSARPALELIRQNEMVAAASPHYNWYGIIGLTGDNIGVTQEVLADSQFGDLGAVQLVGVDVEAEYAATDLRKSITREPRFGSPVSNPDAPFDPPPGYDPYNDPDRPRPRPSVILGEQLFRSLGISRGDFIKLMTAVPDTVSGDFETFSREYVVAGTFRSGENEMDLDRIYMEREELVDLVSSERDFNEILVRLHDYENQGQDARDALYQSLAEADLISGRNEEVRTWEDYRQILLGAIENERTLMAIMLSLVLMVAGFTVFAILSMMVTEKRRDVGILTALGATPSGVMWTFLMVAFWDALVGAGLGCILGTWAALKIDAIEQWLSSTFGIEIFNRNVYLFDHIPSVVQPLWVATIVMGAFLCALTFAAYPAWQAARMHPLDALRHQ